MFVATLRILKFAVQDFWRNIWLSLVTVSILTLALLSVNILIFMNAMTAEVIASVQDKIDVNLSFKSGTSPAEIDNFQSKLGEIPQVKEISFISKEQALQDFKKKHHDDQKVLETLSELGDNPLLDSLVIKAQTVEDYETILIFIENPDYAALIQDKNFTDHRLIINKIEGITDKVDRFGVTISIIFGIIAVLIVYNAIRVIIYTHREEIAVMRLVGATNSFIRTPFLVESLMYALISVGLTLAILYPMLGLVQPYFNNLLADYGFDLVSYFNSHFLLIFGVELVSVIILTAISSGLAISKYLRV
ncbi:MAG: cell division protein FtsX [Patescibacteria group bacterium]